MPEIRQLSSSDSDFQEQLNQLLAWETVSDEHVYQTVKDIIQQVRDRGDSAVLELTRRFDRFDVANMQDIIFGPDRLEQAFAGIASTRRDALQKAASRIHAYAQQQKMQSWQYTEEDGTILGQKVTPLDRVGLYVPGGIAAYPSSVLMNAIPAKVAEVPEIVMVVPTPDGEINELVFAAAHIAGIDQVITIGGAQAVAALAYGTESITAVDKIVGPGNSYVATAKRMVFGTVGIDMIAGPSEILIICDGKTDPDWIAMDLFSQAEHGTDSQSILISDDPDFLQQVLDSMDRLMDGMPRADIIKASLQNRGAIILVANMDEAVDVANMVATEHLELSVENPEVMAEKVRHAGAIFMGRHTPEALGDYCAGPNHVLPTSGTARFSSPLGVYDFQKRSSLINCSPEGASTLGKIASELAEGEGLSAHARSAGYRINNN